mgnify:CR=1 FL=1
MRPVALLVAAVAAALLLFLLASASANTPLLAQYYPLLLAVNGAVSVFLFGVVLWQLRRLHREYRSRQFGSRLKFRLMVMFALMATLPGLVIYAVSMQFVLKSINSWFDVRVDAALESGLNLGRSALDTLLADLRSKARGMALDLAADSPQLHTQLHRLREQVGVRTANIYGDSGQVLASSSSDKDMLVPETPGPAALRKARHGSGVFSVEGESGGTLTLRALVPVTRARLSAEPYVLELIQPVPKDLAENAENVRAVHRDYQELTLARQGLNRIYTVTLTLTLLFALFTAIAAAFVLARRLSAPLSILAEGTQAVAQGDFTPRQALPARDELGVLTQSFNRMTRQLDDARALAEKNRSETEAARAYLESVLASLSAGVLAFDRQFRLRAINEGAVGILQDNLRDLADIPLGGWSRLPELRDVIHHGFADHEGEWQRQLELPSPAGSPLTLLVRGSRLPDPSGGGYVVVFDDITELISAQRSAAWGEVARRLAHEIKNPLTPIQLSAERLVHRLADKLEPKDREMIIRASQTIVSQVEAMKTMVNAFRDYAKLGPPQLNPVPLNSLIREVLGLYEASRVRIEVALESELPDVAGDATQVRQVIHNLLQNAEDALVEHPAPHIRLTTRRRGRLAELTIADNGPGFPQGILSRAFEPYVTSKARGTGLGLAIVRKIVDEHRGHIHIANLAEGGAQISIELPLAAPASQ